MPFIFYPSGSAGGGLAEVPDPLVVGTLTASFCRVLTGSFSQLRSEVPNGATAVAFTFNTTENYANAAAKILSIQSSGSEKYFFRADGAFAPATGFFTAQLGTNANYWSVLYINQIAMNAAVGTIQSDVERIRIRGSGIKSTMIQGNCADNSTAVANQIGNATNLTRPEAKILGVYSDALATYANERMAVYASGKLGFNTSDSSISPGNTTIDKPTGRAAIASGQTACVVTNATVTTGSHVFVTPYDIDTNVTAWKVVEASASFTVTVDAATAADWRFKFWVIN